MHPRLLRILKEIQFYTPLRRYFFPRYQYNFTAPQLCFLCECVEATRNAEGAIAEIGCANGATTIFLNKYMDGRGIEKPYHALDTFEGFVAADVDHEVNRRGKDAAQFTAFQVNKRKWFDATMRMNGISRVQSIQADVNAYDLAQLAPLAFALFDVDLYRPMRKGLPELYDALAPGGILVIDDCDPAHEQWDGAAQAYHEFCNERGLTPEVVHTKLGVLRKV